MIFESEDEHQPNKRLAAKTIKLEKPDGLTTPERKKLVENLEREINFWIAMPPHHNIVPALNLDFLPIVDDNCKEIEKVPLVQMPYCESSLKTWIQEREKYSILDRCVAIGYMCNGLSWLYKHGIEGHGDLKPDNVLLRDLRDLYADTVAGPNWPTELGPWMSRVTDLGWANAWIDLGYTEKGWEPYIAPERFSNTVEPVASDMFAVGVIITELFSGIHPAGKSTKELSNTWSPPQWKEWAQSGERKFSNFDENSLQLLASACLDADPFRRPTPEEIIDKLSEVTKRRYEFDLATQCNEITEQATSDDFLHSAWAPHQIARMSATWQDKEIEKLTYSISVDPADSLELARWLVNWNSLISLLEIRNQDDDTDRLLNLAIRAANIIERMWPIDLRKHFYPRWTNCTLDPKEVIYDYAKRAISLLKDTSPTSVANLCHLFEPISDMYARRKAENDQQFQDILKRIENS